MKHPVKPALCSDRDPACVSTVVRVEMLRNGLLYFNI